MKKVQIAHVDRDSSNNEEDNLVALCLSHHDKYDSTPRQTKRLTAEEVTRYRDELDDLLENKKRTVESTFIGPDGRLSGSTSDAQRFGLIVDAFDEDVARQQPNGLRLAALAQHFIEVDGDFAASQEAITCLLRLVEHETAERIAAAASFLLGQNTLPVASPVVSLGRAVCAAHKIDGMLFVSLIHMITDWAFRGEKRGFKDLSIADVPRPEADPICTCLAGMARGLAVPCDECVQNSAVKDLVELACRITIAYALQGYELPERIERIYHGHYGRVAPGPGFIGSDGPIEDYERGRWPPNLWFNVMHMVARLPPSQYQPALAAIPKSLADWEGLGLFSIADDGEVYSVGEAKNLADLWTTIWAGAIISGPIRVSSESELAEVLAHVRHQKATAERALDRLRQCLHDEHRLLWQTEKRSISKEKGAEGADV